MSINSNTKLMNNQPPAIRILPMDSQKEFPDWSIEKVQQEFFLEELPFRESGEYFYHKSGLNAEPGTLVLFQYRSCIIASAILNYVRRFDQPKMINHLIYEGALYFDIKSIKVFNPLGTDVLGRIWPEVKRLGHTKWKLNPQRYTSFEQELKGIEYAKT